MKLRDLYGINCFKIHNAYAATLGGELRYGYAEGPDGRFRHVWIRDANNALLDLFGWTDHEDMGSYPIDPVDAGLVLTHLRTEGVVHENRWVGVTGVPTPRSTGEAQ